VARQAIPNRIDLPGTEDSADLRRSTVKLRPTRPLGWVGEDIDLVWGDRSGYSVAL
jgi:hypothetical protein